MSVKLKKLLVTTFSILLTGITCGTTNDSLMITNSNSICMLKGEDCLFKQLEPGAKTTEEFLVEMCNLSCEKPPLRLKIRKPDKVVFVNRITTDNPKIHLEEIGWKEVVRVPLYLFENIPVCAIFCEDKGIMVCNNKSALESIIAVSPALSGETYDPINPQFESIVRQNLVKNIISAISKDYGILYTSLDKNENPFASFVKIAQSEGDSQNAFLDPTVNYTRLTLIGGRLHLLKACSRAIFGADENTLLDMLCGIYWKGFESGISIEETFKKYQEEQTKNMKEMLRFFKIHEK